MHKWSVGLTWMLLGCGAIAQELQMLNVSYDPTREFYQEYDTAFSKYWQRHTGNKIKVRQSHGGSGKQATSVINGMEADVVTLALAYDIDTIAACGRINKDWIKHLQDNSAPYTSTIVFLVRKGNPKKLYDWPDLIKHGISVITPNPKTSGGARWNYLAAWGYALHHNNNNKIKARDFVKNLYDNVKVLDFGTRSAAYTFVERGIGDVLISWENEALLAEKRLGQEKFEIIVPSESILAEPAVAVVDTVVDKRGTRDAAMAYLQYLYTPEGQSIAAKNYYRPRDSRVAAKFAAQFPKLHLFTIEETFGGWSEAQRVHFATGGVFDEINKH